MKSRTPEDIKNAGMERLLDLWDITETAPFTPELPTVRGWIMEELRRRNPEAYAAWQDVDPITDPELDTPRIWFYRIPAPRPKRSR